MEACTGLSAIFSVESGFDSTNGVLATPGRPFSRQAFVGISSSYGTLTLGRQYDPLTGVEQQLKADLYSGCFATPRLLLIGGYNYTRALGDSSARYH